MRYKPDPRIVIVIADITYSRMHSTLEPIPGRIYYKDVLDCWAKLPNLKFFRGYNWNLAESFLPYSKLKMWADDLPMYHAMDVQGVYNEEEVAWATLAPGNYLEAKLLWNVKADPAAVLDDFCRAAFGKGAVPMVDYYHRLTERQSAAIQVEHPSNSELGTGGIVYPSFLFAGPRLASRAPKCDKVERLLPGGAVE